MDKLCKDWAKKTSVEVILKRVKKDNDNIKVRRLICPGNDIEN